MTEKSADNRSISRKENNRSKLRVRGVLVAQLVKHVPLAQVMISKSWD